MVADPEVVLEVPQAESEVTAEVEAAADMAVAVAAVDGIPLQEQAMGAVTAVQEVQATTVVGLAEPLVLGEQVRLGLQEAAEAQAEV